MCECYFENVEVDHINVFLTYNNTVDFTEFIGGSFKFIAVSVLPFY